MNNQQFRNLLLSNSQKKDGTATSPPASRSSATPALGSRKRSSIPMTPRQVGGRSVNAEFARQLAERNEKANPNKKKYRSAAPKGTKLAAGYVDRTKSRVDAEEDERAQRIKALEESWKKGEIDRDMFDKMVQEIAGGDYSSTHLVKGLDRKLLEKVRRGEDITADQAKEEEDGGSPGVEDEFDELADKEIGPIVHEKTEKKGQMAPPPPVAGVKRTRAQILADLKESRRLAAEAAEAEHRKKYPSLGPGFRKVGPGGETTRIEVDAEGREILIITGPDGKEKRKVRKAKQEEPQILRHDLENPDKPLEVHNLPPPEEPEPKDDDDEDDDIFEGVGSTYNPLADVDGSDDESSEDEAEEGEQTKTLKHAQEALAKAASSSDSDDGEIEDDCPPAGAPATKHKPEASHQPIDTAAPKPKRTWFNDKPSASNETKDSADATVLAALAKVRTLDASSTLLADTPEARLQKRAAELAGKDRDMEDLDMGFGASRFDDAEEMEHEGEKVKFSEWRGLGGDDDEEDGEGSGRGGKKRKRGGKKRKGDKNSAADVLRVMERQKGGS